MDDGLFGILEEGDIGEVVVFVVYGLFGFDCWW